MSFQVPAFQKPGFHTLDIASTPADTAFQSNAFQNNAFQIFATPAVVGDTHDGARHTRELEKSWKKKIDEREALRASLRSFFEEAPEKVKEVTTLKLEAIDDKALLQDLLLARQKWLDEDDEEFIWMSLQ